MKFEITFKRGGTLRMTTLDAAPKTAAAVKAEAPIETMVYQARWSGREVAMPVNFKHKPPRENQSIRANIGDVIYFQEWPDAYDRSGFENIGIFYGAEIVREWRGDAPVNVFGRIDPAQYDLLREIGDRVWRQGGEQITIRSVED
ncbi:DUF3830 family protein [Reyranella soli]|uniref:DUF3830 domain-containing protein n=1 Tax=Reyranella soli TaxID=1230389 RepID=A0A512NDE4_9HYPH|nr:DUF3830 family protein [Reyranella soli]GEP56970.1 hypothetical protein RSO01_41360 [Reyranella soli]